MHAAEQQLQDQQPHATRAGYGVRAMAGLLEHDDCVVNNDAEQDQVRKVGVVVGLEGPGGGAPRQKHKQGASKRKVKEHLRGRGRERRGLCSLYQFTQLPRIRPDASPAIKT
jgi:hypothetical protein